MQYKENAFLSTSLHEGIIITEWNINGLAEHQIYNKLHDMGVAITAYKIKGSSAKEATTMLEAWFTSMLRHWWDNYFTDDIKNAIYSATATDTIIKVKDGNDITT